MVSCSYCALDVELAFPGSLFGCLAVLTSDDVGGVPSRPMVFGSCRFVLAMMFFGFTQQLGQRRDVKIADPSSRQARGNFLQQPAIAVRITEGGERRITGMRRVRTAGPKASE